MNENIYVSLNKIYKNVIKYIIRKSIIKKSFSKISFLIQFSDLNTIKSKIKHCIFVTQFLLKHSIIKVLISLNNNFLNITF